MKLKNKGKLTGQILLNNSPISSPGTGKGYKMSKENTCHYNILNLVGNNFHLAVYMDSCTYRIIENRGRYVYTCKYTIF